MLEKKESTVFVEQVINAGGIVKTVLLRIEPKKLHLAHL